MVFELPKLPYAYDALEPHIDAQTMEIHHSKHHQAYTNNLNSALEKFPDFQTKTIEDLLTKVDSLPGDIRTAVRNNGGGFYNHNLFWANMSPKGGSVPTGALAKAIDAAFGDFTAFKNTFSTAAATRFGSGWAWLIKHEDGKITVTSTPNQDCPISEGCKPLLTLDVWEHAYYLKYQNRRGDYISAWWNIVNWDEVARRFEK